MSAFADDEDEEVVFPKDLTLDFPQWVVDWIKPTHIELYELIRSSYFYSHSTGGLVRLLECRDSQGIRGGVRPRYCAYETRFHSQRQKSRFSGSKDGVHAICSPEEVHPVQPALCLVEDSLSSIKIGRSVPCAPLFGSSISNAKLVSITKPFDKVYVWLDSDKLNASRLIADRIRLLGKQAEVIYTELDPKYLTWETR